MIQNGLLTFELGNMLAIVAVACVVVLFAMMLDRKSVV